VGTPACGKGINGAEGTKKGLSLQAGGGINGKGRAAVERRNVTTTQERNWKESRKVFHS